MFQGDAIWAWTIVGSIKRTASIDIDFWMQQPRFHRLVTTAGITDWTRSELHSQTLRARSGRHTVVVVNCKVWLQITLTADHSITSSVTSALLQQRGRRGSHITPSGSSWWAAADLCRGYKLCGKTLKSGNYEFKPLNEECYCTQWRDFTAALSRCGQSKQWSRVLMCL